MADGTSGPAGPERLPRRDYILLPAIFLLTMVLILAGGEVLCRVLWAQDDASEPCERRTEAGFRYAPLCTSHTKHWEGRWITQHFNECGYRTRESCAARPPGSLRVAVLGSSTARGALVNYDHSFAARVAAMLSRACAQPVDLQNLGTEPADDRLLPTRVPEALALGASAIVVGTGPFDLLHVNDPPPDPHAAPAGPRLDLPTIMHTLRESRLFLLMQYYLYRDPAFQVRAFLLNRDPADYIRTPLSPAWQARVAEFGRLLHGIAAQAAPAGVPVLLFYVPERAQAALAAMPARPAGIDPFVLGEALRQAAEAAGVGMVDTTAAFAEATDFQSLFYLTDGHPREGGHAAIARALGPALLALPAFAACRASVLSDAVR